MKHTDLGELDIVVASEAGAKIELVNPATHEGLGQYIHIVGKGSQAFRDYREEKVNEARRKAAVASRRGRATDPETYAETDAGAVQLLVNCTTGFSCDAVPEVKKGEFVVQAAKEGGAFLRYRGQNFTFSPDNARKFFSDPGMAEFRDQIDKAIVDVENFIKD